MIRIRTKIGTNRVFTLYFGNEWVTIMSHNGKSQSAGAPTLFEAADNHLAFCQKLKELSANDQRRGPTSELLLGAGYHGDDPRGLPGSNAGSHREGSDGDGGEGRDQVLPTDPHSSQDEESLQLGSKEPQLKEEKENG